jgi:hypothetical protein
MTQMTTKDRAIEFESTCLYQPNAVELSSGIIVFDACGMCADCRKEGRATGAASKDGQTIRTATDSEISRQEAVLAG